MGIYLIIGLIYTLINIFIRKLDVDNDWMIVLVWWFMWPICFIAIIINYLNKKY